MATYVGFTADDKFVGEIDEAVMDYRVANPQRAISRAAFVREATEAFIATKRRAARPPAVKATPVRLCERISQ